MGKRFGMGIEAVEPAQAAWGARIKQENWKEAAAIASNLSQLYLTLGEMGKAVTTATFSEPGEYVLRVLAWDDTGPQAFVMAVGFQCCWTNGYLTVDVR